jgi:hypothetical protein
VVFPHAKEVGVIGLTNQPCKRNRKEAERGGHGDLVLSARFACSVVYIFFTTMSLLFRTLITRDLYFNLGIEHKLLVFKLNTIKHRLNPEFVFQVKAIFLRETFQI